MPNWRSRKQNAFEMIFILEILQKTWRSAAKIFRQCTFVPFLWRFCVFVGHLAHFSAKFLQKNRKTNLSLLKKLQVFLGGDKIIQKLLPQRRICMDFQCAKLEKVTRISFHGKKPEKHRHLKSSHLSIHKFSNQNPQDPTMQF